MAAAKAAASVASSALGALRLDFARPIFVIEHAEGPLGDWSLLEYRHASARVGGARNMMFTSVSRPEDAERLRPYGRVEAASAGSLGLERVCVLDPKAEQELVPEDAARFDYVVIGGILGTFDFNGRTGREVSSKLRGAELRHVGPRQFSTDTAVIVAKLILVDGVPLARIPFMDNVRIDTAPHEVDGAGRAGEENADGKAFDEEAAQAAASADSEVPPELQAEFREAMAALDFDGEEEANDGEEAEEEEEAAAEEEEEEEEEEQDKSGDKQGAGAARGVREWTRLPYRYVRGEDGQPWLAPGLLELLRAMPDRFF